MVKVWDGPTEKSIKAFNDGWAIGQKLKQIEMLEFDGDPIDWFPDVDVFDDYKTSLRITDFDDSWKGWKNLEAVVRALAAMSLIRNTSDVTIERYHMDGWRLTLPVESIALAWLDRLLAAQTPKNGAPVAGPKPTL
jgi:hypothetical protein